MLPTIFCPNCQAYLGPSTEHCPACGQERTTSTRLPDPGQPLWQAQVSGAALSRPVLAGEHVYFCWGARHASGGVVCLHRYSGKLIWEFHTNHAVEGGLALYGDYLYFGTLGFLGSGAQMYCLRQDDGDLVWQRDLSGGAWSAPLLSEARVYIGTDDGRLHCFDNRDGQPVSQHQPLQLEPGRMWLAWVDECLLAVSQSGQLMAVNPVTLKPHWHQPLHAGQGISSAPTVVGNKVFFGGSGGKLFCLDFRQRQIDLFAEGFKRVVAAPYAANEQLYLGAQDRHVHVFDLGTGLETWKSQEFEHSITASPFVADGLVAVAVNQFGVCLLEAETGEMIWEFQPQGGVKLFSDLLVEDGVVYFGTDTGALYALPWHLGNYAWAAGQREVQERFLEAGSYYAAASWFAPLQECKSFLERAFQAWYQSEHPEWAAYLQESDITSSAEQIAQVYQQAGELLAHKNSALASNLLLTACDWYEEVEDDDTALHCRRMAARLTRAPHIHIKAVTVPRIWQEDNYFTAVFELKNSGQYPARHLRVRFAGDLKSRIWVEIHDMPAKASVEVEVPLMANSPGNMVVEARFKDHQGTDLRTNRRFEIEEVKLFEGMLIEGSVGWLELDDIPGKVIVKGDVGVAKVHVDKGTSQETQEATFEWPELTDAAKTEEQTLIQVRVVNEQVTVPTASWAIFLADEIAIATVAPGRHQRKKYPPLRSKLGERDKPVWKAVLFSASPFRMFYRCGPLRTTEGAQIGVECGLTAEFDERKPFDLWKGILGDREQLNISELADWLQGEILGTLGKWLAGQSEVSLSPGFELRQSVMLSLLEELRETHQRYGICLLEPIWWLNFVIPGREKVDNIREQVYWQQQEGYAKSGSIPCKKCSAAALPEDKYCEQCGEKTQ